MTKSKITTQFIKNNPDVIFTWADKGNSTISMSKTVYIQKLLSNSDTYIIVDKDPIRTIESNLKDILNRWHNKKFINNETKKFLSSSKFSLPRAYGVPKIHKENPLRLIVSTINSPLHKLAQYLHQILYKSVSNSPFFVDNSLVIYTTSYLALKLTIPISYAPLTRYLCSQTFLST